MLEDIKTVLKVGQLDSALLFLASSLALIFSFLQIVLGGNKAILYFLPILVLGWFFPFYFGFVEGGILNDSALDRTRGWIYLFIGCGIYIASLMSNIFIFLFPQYPSLRIGGVFIVFIAGFLLRIMQNIITNTIFNICRQNTSKIILKSVDKFSNGAIYFAFGSFFLVQFQDVESITYETVTLIFFVIFFFGIWYNAESLSRYYSKRKNQKYTVEIKDGNIGLMKNGKNLFLVSFLGFIIFIYFNNILQQYLIRFHYIFLVVVFGILTIIGLTMTYYFKSHEKIIFQD